MLRQFGSLEDTEAAGEEDFLSVDLEQGEKKVEKTFITLKGMDAKNKKQFVGKKVGDSFDIDVVKSFPNETDRASLLRIKKDEFDAANPVYKLTVVEVKTFVPAKIDQNLFDSAFGKDVVKDEKGFDKALEEKLKSEYKQESDWRFRSDLIDYIVKKADITLPEDFLKRWLFRVNDGKFTMEQIEKEFPLFLQDYRWQMITRKFFEDQKMKISREDLLGVAKEMTANHFAMYGIPNVAAETVNQYAEQMLNNEKELNRVYEKCEEDFVTDKETLYNSLFVQHAAECLLLREEGCESVIGFAVYFHNFSTFVGRRGLYVEELFIIPEKRGMGYGTATLRHLAKIAVERHCGRMEWICIDWNLPALSVYRAIGAIPMDE
jgi:trigger factor